MRALPLLVLALLALPVAHAQTPPSRTIDIVVTVPAEGAPTQAGPLGILTFANDSGDRLEWRLTTERDHVSVELRLARAFDAQRPAQIVPLLELDRGERHCMDVRARGACDDATFAPSPHERVWEGSDLARLYHRSGTLGDLVLRLNIPGPANGTLALATDLAPPVVTVGEPRDITHYGFYLETRTDELAIVDVQVRELGKTEWVLNPTPELNLLQRFPVQGLSPDTEYEYRVVAYDWSENTATLEPRRIRSAPAPVVPVPVVKPVAPAPNATVQAGTLVVVRATVESPDSPPTGGVQVFFDKRAAVEGIAFDGRDLSYTPQTILEPGRHTVTVEVVNAAGGKGSASWAFDMAAPQAAPGAAVALLLGALAAVALALRGR